MFRNRLIELASFTKEPDSIGAKLKDNPLDETITDVPEDNKYLRARELINNLTNSAKILKKSKQEYLKTANPERQRKIYDEVNATVAVANKNMKELKQQIEEVNQEYNKELEEGDKSKFVECKRVTLEATEAIRALKDAEEDIMDRIKQTLQRQASQIQGPNETLTDRQLQDLIAQPQKGQQMLKQKLLDAHSVQLENAVSDIIDKCNQVKRLQRNMRQCLTMMDDLSDMVKLQGEKLVTIEEALDSTKDHVQKGQGHLVEGKKLHKKSQRKMCCIMMILLIIIGVIVIPIVITKV